MNSTPSSAQDSKSSSAPPSAMSKMVSSATGLFSSLVAPSSRSAAAAGASTFTSSLASSSSTSKASSSSYPSGSSQATWAESSTARQTTSSSRSGNKQSESMDQFMDNWDNRFSPEQLDLSSPLHPDETLHATFTSFTHQQHRYHQPSADILAAQSQDGAEVLQLLSSTSHDMEPDLAAQMSLIDASSQAFPDDEITEDPVEWLMTSGTGGGYTQQVWGTGVWSSMREQFDDEPEIVQEAEEVELVIESKGKEKATGLGEGQMKSRL